MKRTLKLQDWIIDMHVDDDNHLSIWVKNMDGSTIIPTEADIAADDSEWAERFTTEKIEEDYERTRIDN